MVPMRTKRSEESPVKCERGGSVHPPRESRRKRGACGEPPRKTSVAPLGAASLLLVLTLCSGAAGASAADEVPTGEEVLLQVADRIQDEAERQYHVRGQMDLAIGRFRNILVDLGSNGLVKQGGGPALDRLIEILDVLSHKHVPDAARYLEEARKQLQALRPNLVSADKEIEIIVAELEKVLAQGPGPGEDLLRELEVIIEDERRTHDSTKEWGAKLLQDPDTPDAPRREIAGDQRRIARRTDRFMERLAKARDAETDPAEKGAMQDAHQVLEENKVTDLLDGAGRDIQGKKPVAATQAQAKALQALEEAAKCLRRDAFAADLQAMKELRDRLAHILKEQIGLRETTDAVPEAKFPERKNELQVAQRGLDNELGDASRNLPSLTSPQLKDHLDAADGHMQQAENRIAATRQQPAVTSQKAAEQALKDAIKQLDQDIAAAEAAWDQQNQPMQNLADLAQKAMELAEQQRALRQETGQTPQQGLPQLTPPQAGLQQQAQALHGQLPMPQFQQAAQAMQQAGQSLQQSRQQPAMGQQQQAIDALMAAAQALQQAQAAMDLAAQQAALMHQTGQTPAGNLPGLSPSQQGLQQQAQAGQFPQAAGHMGQADQSLQAGQGQSAMQSQQAAIDSLLGQAGQAMGMQPGQGMQPGMAPGMGMVPGMGMMPGMAPGIGPAMPMSQTNDPQQMGIRDFGRQKPAGPNVKRGSDYWNPLGGRGRDALYQKYVNQLPPEYRELLGDYYKALSSGVPRVRTPPPTATETKP